MAFVSKKYNIIVELKETTSHLTKGRFPFKTQAEDWDSIQTRINAYYSYPNVYMIPNNHLPNIRTRTSDAIPSTRSD